MSSYIGCLKNPLMILNGQIPTTLTALTSSLSFKSSGLRSCFGRTWTRGSHRWRAGQEAGDGRRRAAAAAPTATFLWWLGLRGGKQDLPWRGLDILDSLDIYSHCHISNHISDIYSVYIYIYSIYFWMYTVSVIRFGMLWHNISDRHSSAKKNTSTYIK